MRLPFKPAQVNDLKANLDRIALGGDEASRNKHLERVAARSHHVFN